VNAKITKSLAILVNDPDAPGGGFVHWIAWNMELVTKIPEKIPKIPVVTFPFKAVQGKNSFWKHRIQRSVCLPMGRRTGFYFKSMVLILTYRLLRGLQRTSLSRQWKDMLSSMARRM